MTTSVSLPQIPSSPGDDSSIAATTSLGILPLQRDMRRGRAWPRPNAAARIEVDGDACIADAVRTLGAESRTVAVVGAKGGVGTTTVALLAGALLAAVPEARPALVELAADWGATEHLLGAAESRTVADLLAHLTVAHRAGLGFVQGFLTPWERLPVLLAPRDPAFVARLTVVDYARALRLLAAHYHVVILDCGPSLTHPFTRFALDVADHIVLVAGPDPVALHRTRIALHYLTEPSPTENLPSVPASADSPRPQPRTAANLTVVLNGANAADTRALDSPPWKEVMPTLNAVLSLPRSEPLYRQFATGTFTVDTMPLAIGRATKAVLAAVLGRLAYPQGDSP